MLNVFFIKYTRMLLIFIWVFAIQSSFSAEHNRSFDEEESGPQLLSDLRLDLKAGCVTGDLLDQCLEYFEKDRTRISQKNTLISRAEKEYRKSRY